MNFLIIPFLIFPFFPVPIPFWGFYGHVLLNRQAVFSLPPEMLHLYKQELRFVSEKAVNPDRRRYAVKGEAEKHYIDLDHYGDSALYKLPKYWAQAIEKFPEDSLRAHGIGPWQAGIHGFWESRVPELLAINYTFWVGKAAYVSDPQQALWESVAQAHSQVDSVLDIEKILSLQFPVDQKYRYEERNGQTVRVYSREFTSAYALALDGQVERQMKRSIKMIADFWYTAWVNAGQPDLSKLPNSLEAPQDSLRPNSKIRTRTHDN